jgi:glutathione S-transferase
MGDAHYRVRQGFCRCKSGRPVPALVTDDGTAICKSNLICRYLAARVSGAKLIRECSNDFIQKQRERIARCFEGIDVPYLVSRREPTIAHVVAGIACGYMDFRFPADAWRDSRSALARWYDDFATRGSMKLTMPAETPQHR